MIELLCYKNYYLIRAKSQSDDTFMILLNNRKEKVLAQQREYFFRCHPLKVMKEIV